MKPSLFCASCAWVITLITVFQRLMLDISKADAAYGYSAAAMAMATAVYLRQGETKR